MTLALLDTTGTTYQVDPADSASRKPFNSGRNHQTTTVHPFGYAPLHRTGRWTSGKTSNPRGLVPSPLHLLLRNTPTMDSAGTQDISRPSNIKNRNDARDVEAREKSPGALLEG